jgi:hypothetical protein
MLLSIEDESIFANSRLDFWNIRTSIMDNDFVPFGTNALRSEMRPVR